MKWFFSCIMYKTWWPSFCESWKFIGIISPILWHPWDVCYLPSRFCGLERCCADFFQFRYMVQVVHMLSSFFVFYRTWNRPAHVNTSSVQQLARTTQSKRYLAINVYAWSHTQRNLIDAQLTLTCKLALFLAHLLPDARKFAFGGNSVAFVSDFREDLPAIVRTSTNSFGNTYYHFLSRTYLPTSYDNQWRLVLDTSRSTHLENVPQYQRPRA